MTGSAAEAGREPHAAHTSGAAAASSTLNVAHDGRKPARRPVGEQDSDAARHPESGGHKAAAAVAPAGMARSGSDASSLVTDTTMASGVSSGLGNARTAADSYGGSVFASALNQEAGLQLLSQVQPLPLHPAAPSRHAALRQIPAAWLVICLPSFVTPDGAC